MDKKFLKSLIIIVIFIIIPCYSESVSFLNTFSTHTTDDYLNNLITNNEIELNDIELELLDLLGISRRPKVTNRYPSLSKSAPKYLLDIFDSLNNNDKNPLEYKVKEKNNRRTRNALNFLTNLDEMEIEKCNNIMTFLSKDVPRYKIGNAVYHYRMWFNVNQIPRDLSLIRSELRIFQYPSLGLFTNTNWTFTITVYQIESNNLKIISSVNTTSTYQGWLEIDVTSTFRNWIKSPKENYGMVLKVEIKDEEIIPQNLGFIDIRGDEEYQPFIVGFFNGPEVITNIKNLRMKRDLSNNENLNHKKHHRFEVFEPPKACQRMNFSVDFRELNWNDWIIAPEKFDAFFCSGECNFPLGAGMNATNHALVQTLMHLKHSSIPKPCCAPIALDSISVLYYINEESVNLRKYRHMIVNSCGCH